MDGATAIDLSMLKGKQFINLDSEDEGLFSLGCAGGSSTVVNYKPVREIHEGVELDLVYDGASGGHSGSTITRWSVNAIRAIARVIAAASQKHDIRIISMVGGGKDNAIPKRAEARIMVASGEADDVKNILLSEATAIGNEFGTTDPDFKLDIKDQGSVKESVLSPVESKKVATLILALPNGIQKMSADMEGMPETSLNVGILTMDESGLKLVFAVRSALESGRREVERVITLIADQIGGEVEINGEYPAWEYRKDSPLRDKMVRIFEEMFGKKPTTEIIHAGLECGIMSGKIPGLDCISIGADLHDVHTTEEKLSISSTQRTYAYIKKVLAEK
jgi:dipeptidase D